MKGKISVCVTAMVIGLTLHTHLMGADGEPDPTFGGGLTITPVGSANDYAYGAAVQSDGKIVLTGSVVNDGNYDILIARYNEDGSLDSSFGSDGIVTNPIGSANEQGWGVAIQPDGKLVVAGGSYNGSDNDIAVLRYTTNGVLDTTFDSDGIVTTDIDNENDYAYALSIQADGKLVVAGFTDNGSDKDVAVLRYNTNGVLDTSFDTDGIATNDLNGDDDYARDVALQANGKIVVATRSGATGDRYFGVVRYNSNGSLDTTFDSDGIATTDIVGSQDDWAESVAIQPDGKIVAAGRTYAASFTDIAVVRYNTNGTLDTTFDTDGIVTTSIGSKYEDGYDVAIQPNGKIVVAGRTWNTPSWDFAVVRYNTNGSLDTTFDTDGKVVTVLARSHDTAYAMVVQSDGRIVLAGSGYPETRDYDIIVMRYNANGSLDGTLNPGRCMTAIGDASNPSDNDSADGVVIQPDGKIVAVGSSSDGAAIGIAVVRYNTDGILDTSFDTDGIACTRVSPGGEYGYDVALQSDGKIVAAGHIWNAPSWDIVVARYNSNGSLDTTFDTDGKAITAVGTGHDYGYAVAIQSDGKIVVAGRMVSGSGDYDFFVMRHNTNGSLDTAFDGDGRATAVVGADDDWAQSMAIQPDGKIVAAGRSDNGTDYDIAVVRYTTNGILDTTFDANGIVTTDVDGGNDYGYDVVIQHNGRILVVGSSFNGTDNDFALVRYNANGSLDTSFNGSGKVITAIGSSHDVGRSVCIQSNLRIIVAGYSYNGSDHDFALAMYYLNGSLKSNLGIDGTVTTAITRPGIDMALAVALQADGRIVLVGKSHNGIDYDISLVRYLNSTDFTGTLFGIH